ncbi:MAG TPA: hypothetical protein VLH56_08595 [Dissulfurispiraceae bacterium]|nr:hypothetical protein [Dissulfurispiraceae bacterium]
MESVEIQQAILDAIEKLSQRGELYLLEVDAIGNVKKIPMTKEEYFQQHEKACQVARRRWKRSQSKP